jgi:hypothetical protein
MYLRLYKVQPVRHADFVHWCRGSWEVASIRAQYFIDKSNSGRMANRLVRSEIIFFLRIAL